MKTRYDCKTDTLDSVKDWLETDGLDKTEDEVQEEFYQIIDDSIPIYNADLLSIVSTNLRL